MHSLLILGDAARHVDSAIDLAEQCARAYRQAPDHPQRMFSQLFFERLEVFMDENDEHQIEAALAPLFDELFRSTLQSIVGQMKGQRAEEKDSPAISGGAISVDFSICRALVSNKSTMVVLVDLCSSNSLTGVSAADLRRIRQESAREGYSRDIPSARRKWKRLSEETRAEVISGYEAGETSTELAKKYGVAKSTILGILRANNVTVRRQPLTEEQVAEAKALYESGLSLSEVSDRLKINQETVRLNLFRAGVELRRPTGG